MTEELTVGQVAGWSGVTVRTLHHYDRIGLLVPGERSAAGYRLYTPADLTRLQQVVGYRRLGFTLEEIAALLDDPGTGVVDHLRRQRQAVADRQADLADLARAIDRALEAHMSGTSLTPDEQREIFGESFSDSYAEEAEQRWGETDAWQQSRARTSQYGKADWVAVKAEMDAVHSAFTEAKRAGEPATGERAMAAAEQHRQHITDRFYDTSYEMHRGLADTYIADERFTATYEAIEPGLAEYVRDAIHANADRRDHR